MIDKDIFPMDIFFMLEKHEKIEEKILGLLSKNIILEVPIKFEKLIGSIVAESGIPVKAKIKLIPEELK